MSRCHLLLQDTVASPMLARGLGGSPLHTGTSPTPLSTMTAWRQEGLFTAVLQYGRPRPALSEPGDLPQVCRGLPLQRSKQDGVADIPQMGFLLCENLLLPEVPQGLPLFHSLGLNWHAGGGAERQ